MTAKLDPRDDDARYQAMKTHDARFDGRFYTGVTSTGIYCRPVCKVRIPKRENCRFFALAAQAEGAGFRPCLRCRPELAPQTQNWSIQDASSILAQQAARLLDEPEAWGDAAPSVQRLAGRLGVSDRHVRSIFEAQFGVSPLQYLQTRRLLTAKQLLTDTDLGVTQIALHSGYASVRRFNAAFLQHYQLNPSQLRRSGAIHGAAGTSLRLGYRPPYAVDAMLQFFGKRALDSIEFVSAGGNQGLGRALRSVSGGGRNPGIGKTLRIASGGQVHCGWLHAGFDLEKPQLLLRVSDSLRAVLPLVIRRVRAMFDLDAEPQAIDALLKDSFPLGEGLRVPGALDGFELSVRAVLGQQVSVAAARTLAQRLVQRFGEPLQTPWPQLTHLFPSPAVLAGADGESLGQLGIVRQRQAAIVALARAVADQRLQLHAGADVPATVAALKELPGIGEWTAQYIAMRVLRWPDAFVAGDVALHKALGLLGHRQAQREADALSQAWRPWRSYAVIRAWSTL